MQIFILIYIHINIVMIFTLATRNSGEGLQDIKVMYSYFALKLVCMVRTLFSTGVLILFI
jgi:hypothetical protein